MQANPTQKNHVKEKEATVSLYITAAAKEISVDVALKLAVSYSVISEH